MPSAALLLTPWVKFSLTKQAQQGLMVCKNVKWATIQVLVEPFHSKNYS